MKLDYINFHLTSPDFEMKDFQKMLLLLELFGDEEMSQEMAENPLFKFFEKTEQIQAKVKLASIRKIVSLYEEGIPVESRVK